ncbi:hypothetical protein BABINDRAFT_162147 [Babjeviella inositovora NRRL Y-12698]|uniref:Actin cytoskeleton-regulatory complex protein END3 n=1 Tax=Babjeviella inositovora NRRL Y-12698 TaxID=984486 RepID=A0A1E3QMZ1_9ASCO|nr:uncharacterized protein BABINDRAFT_162147 [Babjeviella inositovora NRRL Y-12698]ODQ79076.1 hypothetical protein BABINDRAFT_162147 [Babjeviella inositovora NRRL Y-12698]
MAPKLEEWEIKKYWEIFSGLQPTDGKLSGEKVSPVLKNSRLADAQLGRIWDLSDIDSDGELDFEEFCIAMRLIFDVINGTMSDLPEYLPDWLIPASKSHLIQANRALNHQPVYAASSDDDDELGALSDDFDWYISPTDKATYETIYNSATDHLGRIRFAAWTDFYHTLPNVPQTDVSSAWNLVNPKQFETIDKDQALVFLHILSQRQRGRRVPRGVPASLRATFSKEVPDYSLTSHQANVSRTKQSFADSYASRVGGSTSRSNTGTDFSATKDTDWEEVHLRRELADLEAVIAKAEAAPETSGDSLLAVAKHEFTQLLAYKEAQLLAQARAPAGWAGPEDDITLIAEQVQSLEAVMASKKAELAMLQLQIASERNEVK